jgi:hypothetical protein
MAIFAELLTNVTKLFISIIYAYTQGILKGEVSLYS